MTTVVDVHAHALVLPPALLTDAELLTGRRLGALVDLDTRLAAMDAAGVDVQAVSAAPGSHDQQRRHPRAAELVQASNDGLAGLVRRAPDRLVGIGAVDLRHPGLAAEQLRRAVDDYDFRGVQVCACGAGDPTDRTLDPFWSMARALGIPVFVHPPRCGDPGRPVAVAVDPAGSARVLWGSGYPFHAGAYRSPSLTDGLSPDERAAVLGGDACPLLRI